MTAQATTIEFLSAALAAADMGSPNLTNGPYRDHNVPLQLLLCRSMVAYAVGVRREVRRELRRSITAIGADRSKGHGLVVDIEVETIDDDYSMTRDGIATRFIPREGAPRLVRPRPPYWNICGRVACCEIGERV